MVSDDQRKEAILKAIEWLNSDEGREQMRKSAEATEKFCEELRKTRDIPYEMLHRPFTI